MTLFEDFNWEYYVNNYEDLKKNNINTFEKAYNHWKLFGEKEGRICNKIQNESILYNEIDYDLDIKIDSSTKLCLFATYYNNINEILLYAKYISPYVDYIIILSNIKIKTFSNIYNLVYKTNIGYDFGIYLKLFKVLKIIDYPKELILINDSCIIHNNFKSFFNWSRKYNDCLLGLTDNYDINYHIQSYFLYFKGMAVKECFYFMNRFNINQLIKELQPNDYYDKYMKKYYNISVENNYKFYIIVKFEIGISQFIKKKYNLYSYYIYNANNIYNNAEYYLNKIPVAKKDIIYKNKELYKKVLLNRKINGL
jgi:hypothetical protein